MSDETRAASRRDFLKLASAAAPAAAVAAVAGTEAEASVEPQGSGYRETAHVRTYYETARF